LVESAQSNGRMSTIVHPRSRVSYRIGPDSNPQSCDSSEGTVFELVQTRKFAARSRDKTHNHEMHADDRTSK
jgi:hypothetical protein